MRCLGRLSGVRLPPLISSSATSSYHTSLPAHSVTKQPTQLRSAASRVIITPLDNIDTFFESGPTWSVYESFQRPQSQPGTEDITEEELQHLGNLTALHVDLSTTHGQQLRRDVKMMVSWLSPLKDVNTEGVEPMWTPLQMIEKQMMNDSDADETRNDVNSVSSPRYRDDTAVLHPNPSELLANVPHQSSGYVLVPKILGGDDAMEEG